MNKKNIISGAILSIVLSGCFEQQEVKTVEWYKTHQAERESVIAKCTDNPGELKDDPNCINANQAELQAMSGDNKLPSFHKPQFKWRQ